MREKGITMQIQDKASRLSHSQKSRHFTLPLI